MQARAVLFLLLSCVDCIWWKPSYRPHEKQTSDNLAQSVKSALPLPSIIFNNTQEANVSILESPLLRRCRGRYVEEGKCCSSDTPCVEGAGGCEDDSDCSGDLVCGRSNCQQFGSFFHQDDNCCVKAALKSSSLVIKSLRRYPLKNPYPGQRCTGRINQGRRCCTPESPCDEGEGDCDGPIDGGGHDGNAGCKGDLVCGSNNCKKFGLFYHEKDDCCEKRSTAITTTAPFRIDSESLLQPPSGQRCSGRNYEDRRCCTPEEPCGQGEGDCDGPEEGGQNDGHAGCKGDLVCGSNNCRKFGAYFHEKDDCCEGPVEGWSQWEAWSPCSASCGAGWRRRERRCRGKECKNKQQLQERLCNTQPCTF